MSNFLAAAEATTKPPLPHQQAAWNYCWDLLSLEEQQEFLSKFRADPAPKAASMWQQAASLIREFEGFESTAYPDPATGDKPWTLGWGFTSLNDALIKKGDTISREDADALLDNWIETKVVPALARSIPGWKSLPVARQNALVSFAWNVGWGFYGAAGFETISKCLRENYDGVPAAMLLYINPGSNVEAGLRRRREAEGKLWGVSAKATSVLLKVPYEYQLDNKSGTGYRECFSSSCAMIAKYYGKVKSDDEYNAIRSKFGDTTSSQAQLAALRSLGLQARFVTNAAPGLLELELRANRPVAVGWLHQGPYNAPSGGGHWSVVIGFTDAGHWILNDPNGEADLINGGYVNHTKGAGVKYSMPRFNRRWEADGSGTGWCLLVKP